MFRAFSEHKLMIAVLFVVGLGLSCALPAGAEPILVAEKWANTIHLYTLKADKTVTYAGIWADGSAPLAPGVDPLDRPNRMALLNDKVYVAENPASATPRVLRFDRYGNFEAVMPLPSTTWTVLGGAIIAHNGALYVSDALGAGTNNIYKISNPGSAAPTTEVFVGAGVYDDTALDGPRGIAFRSPDGNANFYLGDRANNRFLEFDASGTYQDVFNVGNNPSGPQFIAWKDDLLYSAEGGGIRLWNDDGTRGGWHVNPTNNPTGHVLDIAWSLDDDLYYIGFTGTGEGETGLYRRNANGTVTMLADGSSIPGHDGFVVASGLLIIPEPSSALLLLVGFAGLTLVHTRARKRRRGNCVL